MSTLLTPLTAQRHSATGRRSLRDLLLARDGQGTTFRVMLVGAYLLIVWFLAILIERPPVNLGPLAEPADFFSFLIRPFVIVIAASVQLSVLRHLVLPIIVLWLGVRAGAQYVDDLFELHDPKTAGDFLLAGLFGWGFPTVEIEDGKVTEASQKTTLFRMGGPGYVKIHLGNAALFERVGGRSRLYGPPRRRTRAGPGSLLPSGYGDRHFVQGFDRLREVVDLRDQLRQPPDMVMYTKDGVAVTAKDIQVIFRLSSKKRPSEAALRSVDDPYPYSEQSVRRVIFGKTVGKDHKTTTWQDSVARAAAGVVLREIGQLRLQDIIAQKEKVGASRIVETLALGTGQAISALPVRRVDEGNTHRAFALSVYEHQAMFEAMGVELIWIGVGTLETPGEVSQELINAWSADRAAHVKVTLLNLDARRSQGRNTQIADVIHHIGNWWLKAHVYTEKSTDAKDILRMYHIKLAELYKNTPDGDWPPRTDDAIRYIHQLTRPHIIGGEY